MKPKPIAGSIYSLHPSYQHRESIIANLEQKTGKDLEGWLEEMKQRNPVDKKAAKQCLKENHNLGGTTSMVLCDEYFGENRAEDYDPEGLVTEQYSGKKGHLLPVYECLLEICLGLAEDVSAAPCKTFVPLYRNNVFAQIKPATQKRIDLGLALGDHPQEGRLLSTGGYEKKDRITHRIEIETENDIDDEVRGWLSKAYDLDA